MSWHGTKWYPGYGTGASRGAVTGPVHLKGLPFGGYPKSYRPTLSQHQTVENAVSWGRKSGLSSVDCTCHLGSVCNAACDAGRCHDGCTGNRPGRLWIEAAGQSATL